MIFFHYLTVLFDILLGFFLFFDLIYWLNYCSTVPVTNLRHFTLKASVTSVHAQANAHSADWLMSVFVNELAPLYVRSQQGQCEQ